MPYSDPEKNRACKAQAYLKNKTLYRRRNKARRTDAKIIVSSIKEGRPCKDCKAWYPYYVMQFDHLHDKMFSISKWQTNNLNIASLQEEIAKCDLLCANCHAVRTYFRLVGQSIPESN